MRLFASSGAPHPSKAAPCRVSGQVKNPAGMPLGGARVTLYPQNVTLITGPDGGFSLLLPPGPLELVVSCDGREPQSLGPVDLGPGAAFRTDVVLPRADRRVRDRVAGPKWEGWVTGHRASVR